MEGQVRGGQRPGHRSGRPGKWAEFLQMISAVLPRSRAGIQARSGKPADQTTLEMLRVHIDAIKPVWRNDVAADWFTALDPKFKKLMHPSTPTTPPAARAGSSSSSATTTTPIPGIESNSALPAGRSQADRLRTGRVPDRKSAAEAQ